MGPFLDRLTIKGFKSIRELDGFELKNLNVVIGGNGSGKSNLVSFFRMLRALSDGSLNRYVRDNGGAGDILYSGRKTTAKMEFEMIFGSRGFRFFLVPTPKNSFAIEDEAIYYEPDSCGWWKLGDSHDGTSLVVKEVIQNLPHGKYCRPVYNAITSWQVYHFHDTSKSAGMRNYEIVQDDRNFRPDGANLAPFLLMLKNKHPNVFDGIKKTLRLVIPFFEDFILEPREIGSREEVNLSWTQRGSDYPLQPYHFSDGSIRFICLAVALLQPDPPSAVIIDEPELGLHPAAIAILAELIQSASRRTQVIAATQSPTLIDYFSIEDIIVANRKDDGSTFSRLNEKDLSEWLKDYTLGELWKKNVIAGGPVYG